jgi:hypothetical protein
MLSKKNFIRGLRNPSLALVMIRRWFPWAAARHDRECGHLISAWSSGRLDRVSINHLFPGIEMVSVVVRKPEARVVGWSLDLQELVHLLAIVKLTKSRRVLEIGTYDGFTALNLAANLGPESEFQTLDLPQSQSQEVLRTSGISNACISDLIGSQFRQEVEVEKVRQLWGDSTREDWAAFGAPFDLILIDGSHDYPYVRSDSLNAVKAILPGATILWHDYGQCVDVSRAVDELALDYPIKAILGTRFACLRMPNPKPNI